jgi:hypothetical protein
MARSCDPRGSDMREIRLVSRYRGVVDVTRKAKPVARVRYDVRHRRMVDTVRSGEEPVEEIPVQALIDGNLQILEGETTLYSDELYTLRLEEKHERECDFHTEPIDVVAGTYHVQVSGDFRKSCYR